MEWEKFRSFKCLRNRSLIIDPNCQASTLVRYSDWSINRRVRFWFDFQLLVVSSEVLGWDEPSEPSTNVLKRCRNALWEMCWSSQVGVGVNIANASVHVYDWLLSVTVRSDILVDNDANQHKVTFVRTSDELYNRLPKCNRLHLHQ